MAGHRIAAGLGALALAVAPVMTASASTAPQTPLRQSFAAKLVFYANGSHSRLVKVTMKGGVVRTTTLVTATSPVWWRTFYLTPGSTAGHWVVGSLSGGQKDFMDPPRMFAFDTATKSLRWLAPRSWQDHSPVVDGAKTPRVFYIDGTTVRRVSTGKPGARSHQVFSAPSGWQITALTITGTSVPYVALTHNRGMTVATATTYVLALTHTPTVVMPVSAGSVTALALSHDAKTLAISRVKADGDSLLTLHALSHGGVTKQLPDVGATSELSWDAADDTLAVDPEQWGGWSLVDVATGATSYPTALQPYGGGVFASGGSDGGHSKG